MIKTHSMLPNGITVATISTPNVHTVMVGAHVLCGTVTETKELNGISHFVEHMVFKGTSNRSGTNIASTIESIGSTINAMTGKDVTYYYAKGLIEHANVCLDVVSDIIVNAIFQEDDLKKEKSVVLHEIANYEDDLDDISSTASKAIAYPNHGAGYSILGSTDFIQSATSQQLYNYYKENYSAGNIIISASGNINHKDFEHSVNKYLGHLPKTNRNIIPDPAYVGGYNVIKRNSNKVHATVLFPGVSQLSPEYVAYYVTAWATQGLALLYEPDYKIYSGTESTNSYGCFYFKFCVPDNCISQALQTIGKVLKVIKNSDMSDTLVTIKNRIKVYRNKQDNPLSFLLARYVNDIIAHNREISDAESRYLEDKISASDISRVAAQLLAGNPTLQLVGNVSSDEDYYSVLQAALK